MMQTAGLMSCVLQHWILPFYFQARQPVVWLHRELPEEQEWDGGVRGGLCHRPHAQLYGPGAGPRRVRSGVYPHLSPLFILFYLYSGLSEQNDVFMSLTVDVFPQCCSSSAALPKQPWGTLQSGPSTRYSFTQHPPLHGFFYLWCGSIDISMNI